MIECETCILEKIVHYCEVDCLALEDALKEHDKQIRAEVIDKILSKIHTTWLFRGNSAKPYREEIDYIIRATFKEQNK